MKLFVVEGNTLRLDGGAMFGNAPKNLWSRWMTPDEQNRIPLASRTLLVQTEDGRHILFETGTGAFFDSKMKERFAIQNSHALLENLAKLGLHENDIDVVILSHLHFDHAGGLLSSYEEGKPSRLLFPKARYYTSKNHWERALNPHLREKASFIPQLQPLLKDSNRLSLIEEETCQEINLPVRFHFSSGHTVGMMLAEIETLTGPLLYACDLVPGVPWVHLPITMGFDRFPEQLVNEKHTLLEYLSKNNGKLFFTHDPTIPCASIIQDEQGKFIAQPLDLNSK